MFLPHHDGSELYVSTLAPRLGETVAVRVRVPAGWAAQVFTRSNPNREPRFSPAALLGAADGWDWWEAPVVVENPAHGYRFLFVLPDGAQFWLNATGVHEVETLDSDDFTIVAGDGAPDWARSSILYQVFPDRFARSSAADARPTPEWAIAAAWGDPVDTEPPGRSQQLYGGDLDGVTEHLDHLEALGVTLLYLTPFFPARSNHRYDSTSFDEVDPVLGGDAALVRLVEAAHARGIRVIGDLTSNHSGDGHEWFVAAAADPLAPEREFYYWREDGSYESWLGVPSLPKFNWNSAELRRRFIEGPDSVVAKWLKPPFSLDGWRIDVANMTGRLGAEDLNAEVRQTIRATMVEANPDTILLAESTNDAASDFRGDAWHGAMTYANFTRPLWGWLSVPGTVAGGGIGFAQGRVPQLTGRHLVESHRRFTAGFPWRVRLATMNALDTHDTPRFLTHALPGSVPVALGLSLTLPGIPVVFAGDEFALTGEDGEHSRTPIPWGSAHGAAADTIALYSELIRLRAAHPALNGGGMRWLHVGDDLIVFIRESAGESILVAAARADFDITLTRNTVTGEATPLSGASEFAAGRIRGAGPSFTVWALPGVRVPAGE